jgi:hypothetical protein
VLLSGGSIVRTVKKRKRNEFRSSLHDSDKSVVAMDMKKRHLEEFTRKQYHQFFRLYSKVLADPLPPRERGLDKNVHLTEGETSMWGSQY